MDASRSNQAIFEKHHMHTGALPTSITFVSMCCCQPTEWDLYPNCFCSFHFMSVMSLHCFFVVGNVGLDPRVHAPVLIVKMRGKRKVRLWATDDELRCHYSLCIIKTETCSKYSFFAQRNSQSSNVRPSTALPLMELLGGGGGYFPSTVLPRLTSHSKNILLWPIHALLLHSRTHLHTYPCTHPFSRLYEERKHRFKALCNSQHECAPPL